MAISCSNIPQPSRTRRTVVLMGVERLVKDVSTGVDKVCSKVNGLEQLVLYENYNPVAMESEVIQLNRAKNGLGQDGIIPTVATYRKTGSVYLHGSGVVNLPPTWTKLLIAAGWSETRNLPNSGADAGIVLDIGVPAQSDDVDLVAANQEGLTETKTVQYKFTRWDLDDATPQESQPSAALTVALTGTNNTVTFDFTASVGAGAWLENKTGFAIYRTRGYTTVPGDILEGAVGDANFYLQGRYLVADVADGLWGAGAYLVDDYMHDNDLSERMPAEAATANSVVYTPLNEDHRSLTVASYLDHGKYRATGVRGPTSFSGDASNPFRGDFELMGVYVDPTMDVDNPVFVADPGVQPRLENIFMTITGRDDLLGAPTTGVIVPRVKSVGCNLGTQVSRRADANAPTGVIEYGVFQEFQPRITVTVEVDRIQNWIKYFRNSEKFRVEWFVHPDGASVTSRAELLSAGSKGLRWQFVAGGGTDGLGSPGETDRFCQITSGPAFDDAEGVRCFNLEITPLGKDIRDPTAVGLDNFLLLKHL